MRRFIRLSALSIVILLICFLAVVPASAQSLPPAASSHLAGAWKSFSPLASGRSFVPHTPTLKKGIIPDGPIGGGGGSPCPSNATGYTGNLAPYNCVNIDYDGELHAVWTRQGSANTFGMEHYQTHNLWLTTVSDVIETSQNGEFQPSTRRWFYGAYFVGQDGNVDQQVFVYEQRTPPPQVNDGNEAGVITAFCADGYGNEEQVCPDWVNESL